MPLSAPLRPFLDWTVDTDPARWQPVDASILGIPTSEAYSGEPRPNDQANAPEAIRAQSGQFSDGPDHWDFDLGGPLGRHLPAGRARDAGLPRVRRARPERTREQRGLPAAHRQLARGRAAPQR